MGGKAGLCGFFTLKTNFTMEKRIVTIEHKNMGLVERKKIEISFDATVLRADQASAEIRQRVKDKLPYFSTFKIIDVGSLPG